MKIKKYKHLGVRITDELHSEFFRAIKKQSKILGRPISASEILVPAIRSFIMACKVDSQ